MLRKPNLPIAYDFHGDLPFAQPFSSIQPKDIHIYLDLDTTTGKDTCGQNCNHCWFVNYDKVSRKSFERLEGLAIKGQLERTGYTVFARYVDSFSYQGEFLKLFGPAHNREFRQEDDHIPTATMAKGDAWTSGRPLMAPNYLALLDQARESGYGTISMTFHGLLDQNCMLMSGSNYPIKGVFPGEDAEIVMERIKLYNSSLPERGISKEHGFRINIGITVGRHNCTESALQRYAHYFNRLAVDTVRFNSFLDHGNHHPHLQLEEPEIAEVYKRLKWIHEHIELNFQMAVSEDFGTTGVEVMGFPKHVGWCRAGRQLFTVIPAPLNVIEDTAQQRTSIIGDIVACVNIFQPHLGTLVKRESKIDNSTDYKLEFDHRAIEDFTTKRLQGVYTNGCFARELLAESPMRPSSSSQQRRNRAQPKTLSLVANS